MRPVNVAILGLGTVGGGTYDILKMNAELIEKRTGRQIRVTKVLDKAVDKCLVKGLTEDMIVDDPEKIFADPEIDIVVEALGGIQPSTDFMLRLYAQSYEGGQVCRDSEQGCRCGGFRRAEENR